jgi:hypothetical protein
VPGDHNIANALTALALASIWGATPEHIAAAFVSFAAAISPDSGLDVAIKFTPTSAGLKLCNLTIDSDDPNNPMTFITLTGTTPTGSASLTFPNGLTFAPTPVQKSAACPEQLGIPVANNGKCPVQINSVGLTQGSSPADYSLTGLPGLPVPLEPGGQLGSGDLDVVFEPFTIARESTGTADFTFVNDPILGTVSTVHVPFCGEAVNRGLRVLVTSGGVPAGKVKLIELQNAFGPEQHGGIFGIRRFKNALLQTVSGTAPCPSFQFHAEWGGVSNAFQLKMGTYRVKVQLKIGKTLKTKIVRVTIGECTFNPAVVVAFSPRN